FWICKGQYAAYLDRLDIVYSLDCGVTWTSIWNKTDSPTSPYGLATQAPTTTAFTPLTTSVWRKEVVNLSSLLGNSNVLISFSARSGNGNNAYIDNINLDLTAE